MFRVLVTGSREWDDPAKVWEVLNGLYREHGPLLVMHGKCPTGADFHAHMWCEFATDSEEKGFAARWRLLGKAAGMIRNSEMVAYGADICVAFFQPGAANKGTLDCSSKADAAGIEVRSYGKERK